MSKSKSNKNMLRRNKPDSDSDSNSDYDSEDDSSYIYESTTDTGSSAYMYDSDESKESDKKKKRLKNSKKSKKSKSKKQKKLKNSKSRQEESSEDENEELFPSKYTKDKCKKDKNKNKNKKSNGKRGDRDDKKSKKKSKRKEESESESDDDDDEDDKEESDYETIDDDDEETIYETEDDDEDNENDDEDDDDDNEGDDKNFKITLTIGGNESPFVGLKNRVASDLSKDEEYTIEDEKTFMRESYEPVGMSLSPSNENLEATVANAFAPSTPKKQKETAATVKKEKQPTDIDIEDKYKEIIELKKVLYEKHRKNPKNKIIKKALEQCDHTVKKLIKHARSKNVRNFEELLIETDIPENTDDLGYFKNKLSNKEQIKVMNDLRELNDKIYVEKPYKLTLLQSNLPSNIKAMAMQRLNQLSVMEPGESEYYKLKNWVDSFMRIPFGRYKNITINISDGIDKCSDFVVNAKKQLDNCVYGLNDAKMQIMQMVGQWISNPSSLGTAIAVKGPPGTGKTSLIKDGVSKILGREFAFIALGGCGDSSFLEGHSYTYEGSTYGKIVQILMDSKCMNPVIYFDELDKVSDTARGQEIISLLTHLTDSTQNSQFRDKYFSELDFDLSTCLFIFSYNDENLVNPILKDRMYRIQTKGYDLKEKQIIARNYMLPKIREQVGFKEDEVIITDDVLTHIISNQAKGEAGVRNLKRCLEIIHTKLNLYRLVKSGTALFEKEMGLQVSFPYTLTRKDVDILVKNEETINQSVLCSMYT
jgi:ATP-dependent Lon protease